MLRKAKQSPQLRHPNKNEKNNNNKKLPDYKKQTGVGGKTALLHLIKSTSKYQGPGTGKSSNPQNPIAVP